MRLLALFVVPLLVPSLAVAECPLPVAASPSLQGRSTADRLRALSRALDADAAASRTWALAWGAIYGVGTLGQLAAIPLLGPEDQKDFVVGVASTAVGVGFTILSIPEVMDDAPAFATRAAAGGDECAVLAEAERLIVKDAANEMSGVTWYMHAVNVAFNLGLGLVIGLGFGHWLSALINFVVGAAIGEGTIFTQPTALDGAWNRYLTGDLGPEAPTTVRLTLAPAVGGMGFAVHF
jgi:hypothetical protein